MLFRTYIGNLVEIKKYDFSNDKLYFEKIMELKIKSSKSSKSTKSFEKINNSSNNTLKCKNT
jgi:hypothetical protein